MRGPVDLKKKKKQALLPIPVRHAAYHLRPYAKKLGAFIHFFMCMHFGEEKDNERCKVRDSENANNRGFRTKKHKKKIYTSKTHTYCISHMKRHGGIRGKGPVCDIHPSVHRSALLCAHIAKTASENVGATKSKRQQSVIITKATGAIKRSRLKYTSAIKRMVRGVPWQPRCIFKLKELGTAREQHAERKLYNVHVICNDAAYTRAHSGARNTQITHYTHTHAVRKRVREFCTMRA